MPRPARDAYAADMLVLTLAVAAGVALLVAMLLYAPEATEHHDERR